MSAAISNVADIYWASHFGCDVHEFLRPGIRLQNHAGELVEYHGVFALFRPGAISISVPSCLPEATREALAGLATDADPSEVAAIMHPLTARVIGPAYIGYTDMINSPQSLARMLASSDRSSVESLRAACEEEAWDHGGSDLDADVCAGSFVNGELAALAGYQVWGGTIAHISIVTHPQHRGAGHGRHAVACVAAHAIQAGLLAQYRTLCANAPSMRIAEKLGFQRYATSIAIRLCPELSLNPNP